MFDFPILDLLYIYIYIYIEAKKCFKINSTFLDYKLSISAKWFAVYWYAKIKIINIK